ncbi:MAG: hypothetical protein WBB69_07620 [Anaerolineales bacterium]
MINLNFRSLFVSIIINLILLFLLHPLLYERLFGMSAAPFFTTGIMPFTLCFVDLIVYPLAGLIYGFRERHSEVKQWSIAAGGGIASAVLFLLFVGISLAITPGGLARTFSDVYRGLEDFYGEQAVLGAVGAVAGLGFGTIFIFAIGAAMAVFAFTLSTRKNG